jgi:DEAD/DEAH box helicase domain-containing protein
VVGEIDRSSAPTMLHEEAIYLHEGQQYQVEVLDLEEKKAYVRGVDVDYYTDAQQAVKIRVLGVRDSEDIRSHGDVEVTYLPTIFKKIKFQTHENVGWGNIYLDEDPFPTTAYWLTIPGHVSERMPRAELETGLRGTAHVLGQVAPLFLMCDPADIRVWPEVKAPFTQTPTIYVYDRVPGGIGFSERLYRLHRQILGNAGKLVSDCVCDFGCPSCIGPAETGTTNAKLCVLGLLGALAAESRAPMHAAGSL